MQTGAAGADVILFGAFDRHNFGDLLFPHIVAALLPRRTHHFAGLADRDLRPFGGHRVLPLDWFARQFRGRPLNLVHAGGELLTCSAQEAAVMLATGHDRGQEVHGLAPYVADPALLPSARMLFNAVGGVDLAWLDAPLREEVIHKLRGAHWVGVRDALTQQALRAHGIGSTLLPDCAVMVAELFGERIARHGATGENARLAQTFPSGYVAVQFSVDFGSEEMLALLADQLERIAQQHRLGIVLFRAGAAPWHDALEPYQRLAARMSAPPRIFESLNVWDICALIARSRVYCGSSLHGRIVAAAHGVARLNFAQAVGTKHAAFAEAWDPDSPGCAHPDRIAQAVQEALDVEPGVLRSRATELVHACRTGFAGLAAALA